MNNYTSTNIFKRFENFKKEHPIKSKLNRIKWKSHNSLNNIKRCPSNLWYTFQYFKIIYRNHHEWDYGYLLAIMIFKLERMEHHFRTYNYFIEGQYIAEEISEVVLKLKRFDGEDYGSFKGAKAFEDALNLMSKQMTGWWD